MELKISTMVFFSSYTMSPHRKEDKQLIDKTEILVKIGSVDGVANLSKILFTKMNYVTTQPRI